MIIPTLLNPTGISHIVSFGLPSITRLPIPASLSFPIIVATAGLHGEGSSRKWASILPSPVFATSLTQVILLATNISVGDSEQPEHSISSMNRSGLWLRNWSTPANLESSGMPAFKREPLPATLDIVANPTLHGGTVTSPSPSPSKAKVTKLLTQSPALKQSFITASAFLKAPFGNKEIFMGTSPLRFSRS